MSRLARALPFMRLYGNPNALVAEARRFHYQELRHNADFDAVLFALQVATNNRLQHLQGMRDDTRALLALLQTQRAGSTKPPARDTTPGGAR